MDGSNSNPAINLQTEFMRSDNIVELFRKYKVPHPGFDHLTGGFDRSARAAVGLGGRWRGGTAGGRAQLPCTCSHARVPLPQVN